MKNTLLTTRELAKLLNRTTRFVSQLTKSGKIPCYDLGPNSKCYDGEAVLRALHKPSEASRGGMK